MKKLLVVCVLLGMTACKTPCSDSSSVATKVSNYVSTNWECNRPDLVQKDISAWMADKNWCKADDNGIRPAGPLAMLVCPFVANYLRNVLADKVPASWECNKEKVGAKAALAFSAVCNLIPL